MTRDLPVNDAFWKRKVALGRKEEIFNNINDNERAATGSSRENNKIKNKLIKDSDDNRNNNIHK